MPDPSPRPPVPAEFAAAVADLSGAPLRAEVVVERIAAPQRLAPWAFALAVEVRTGTDTPATGRLVLLHDPAGHEGWQGTFRFVAFASAAIEADIGWDPMLAGVAWSWLTDALALRGAALTAAGGTVTQTASTRFGALAEGGSGLELDVELRGSWTPVGTSPADGGFAAHLLAFADLLCTAAGLPPEGVAGLSGR